jgi:hypothetical protein
LFHRAPATSREAIWLTDRIEKMQLNLIVKNGLCIIIEWVNKQCTSSILFIVVVDFLSYVGPFVLVKKYHIFYYDLFYH